MTATPFQMPPCPRSFEDIHIVSIVGFRHVTKRAKLIGKNAKKDLHGWQATESAIRIYTDQGLDGVGFGRVGDDQARHLIGRSLADLWTDIGAATSPIGRADHALFDLAGKALGEPAWKLMGAAGPAHVPVYDTQLYFSDLLPEYADVGVARLVEELDDGLKAGHRAFKVKVGRGGRWMEAEEGLRRDIEVVRALSDHAGKDVKLMADANDQYGVETAKRFIGAVGERLTFVEEMFPESVRDGVALRAWIKAEGLTTLLADGESEHDPTVHEALARAGALDIVQPDIRALGLALQLSLSNALLDLPDVHLASHNWGSYLGTFKVLQLGRGISNFLIAEVDSLHSDLFDDSEWRLNDGAMSVPDTPGCGLRLSEAVFRERYLPKAWVVGDATLPAKW